MDSAFARPATSLYVHIPFCASRCFYCDFTTFVAPSPIVERYVEDLLEEFKIRSAAAPAPLDTVFFGGGTPTLLSAEQLNKVMDGLHRAFPIAPDAEITMEANPGTVTEEKLDAMLAGGVNRISFGAQTFEPRLLLAIGRLHDAQAIDASVRLAKAAGFERINLDLMFGLPEQSLADVRDSVARVLDAGIEHMSAYWLKVEPGTPFAAWQAEGHLPLPGEDEEADMYDLIRHMMTEAGYIQYEISNFAKPGAASRHNLVYWRNEPYLAAGVGAHGFVGGERYENVKSLAAYHDRLAQGLAPETKRFPVSPAESCENTMMLGLRLREGVRRRRFVERHGLPLETVFGELVTTLERQGLVCWQDDALRLTDRAWPVGNLVFEQFVGALTN
ncbi:MAG: radical SAM family heme chaperone HemW [Alicyclobacillus sp.]|nr:radical SAM family heme chaperone HemW [Alicyclobacillus sp.]